MDLKKIISNIAIILLMIAISIFFMIASMAHMGGDGNLSLQQLF